MNLIRKYKISKLTNKPLTGIEGDIISFIQEWLKGIIITSNTKDIIFYDNPNTENILIVKKDYSVAYVRYENCWEVMERRYGLSYVEIQSLFKYFIEQKLNRKFIRVEKRILK